MDTLMKSWLTHVADVNQSYNNTMLFYCWPFKTPLEIKAWISKMYNFEHYIFFSAVQFNISFIEKSTYKINEWMNDWMKEKISETR